MSNDKERSLQAHKQDASIPFERLTPDDVERVMICANRVYNVVNEYFRQRGNPADGLLERDKMMLQMDIAVAKLSRGLDLFAFMLADDLTFFSEWVLIQKNIDRSCGVIPDHVPLRFASKGATLKLSTH